jgi:putative ABC transport system permease protein
MKIIIFIAFRNLLQARRRTMLLTLALSIVTMLLVILLSLSQGLTETMIRNATALSSGHINIGGFVKAKSSDAYPLVTNVPKLRQIVRDHVPDLDYVIDRIRGWGKVVSEQGAIQVGLQGIDFNQETRFINTIQLAEEREYKTNGQAKVLGDFNKLKQNGFALCFAAQAKRLQIGVGDSVTITIEAQGGRVNATQVTIAAVAKDLGFSSNWNFFLSKATLYDLYDVDENNSGAVMIYIKDISKAREVMAYLREILIKDGYGLMDYNPKPFFMKFDLVKAEDWVGEKLDLTLWEDEIAFLKWVLTAFDSISLFLVTILTIIICIGIINTMWISVRERTNEIGTIRAIGMSRGRVMLLFLFEALILGFFATTLGSLIGLGIAMGVDAASIKVPSDAVKALIMNDTFHLSVQLRHVIAAIVTFTIITFLVSLWPAARAARMEPVKAIQHVG